MNKALADLTPPEYELECYKLEKSQEYAIVKGDNSEHLLLHLYYVRYNGVLTYTAAKHLAKQLGLL